MWLLNPIMPFRIRRIFLRGLNKGSRHRTLIFRGSVEASKFDMEHLKKVEAHIRRNVANMIMKIMIIVLIFEAIKIIRLYHRNLDKLSTDLFPMQQRLLVLKLVQMTAQVIDSPECNVALHRVISITKL